jgi:hypothetical protein
MEIASFGDDVGAIDSVFDTFYLPEICLGKTVSDDGIDLDYGQWMFIQELAERFGPDLIAELWLNIARYDGFEALERALASYDALLLDVVARYHVRKLARDYAFATRIDTTVWLESRIPWLGYWENLGAGVQELAVNYIELSAPPGLYDVRFKAGNEALELWSVAIRDHQAFVTPLGREATLSTAGYDAVYLMVFNSAYDDDVDHCVHADYTLDLAKGTGAAAEPLYSIDASHFIAPELN